MLSLLRDETYNSYLELFSFVSSKPTPVQPYYCTVNYDTLILYIPVFVLYYAYHITLYQFFN